ncbi:MAG: DSD1 family PLP-dependent enzyme [Emcibacteraceae bacterium]|nr:DSD1 family PLP-dependent enzyme [Emcibacteraceae bacterium]MDG1996468.1 DSD1 family PLP-dependent enzyme [Emcibacteraceae bacterium]
MAQRPPAEVGMSIDEIETPALVVDLDIYERNLDKMAAMVKASGKVFRPHAKMHKSPKVALDQIKRGAIGVCCQKLSEAEILVDGGIEDVLITNEVVAPSKLARVAALAKRAKIGICVDNLSATKNLNDACAKAGTTVRTLIEIDVGGNRCGVTNSDDTVKIASYINSASNLTFGGIQAYHGAVQHIRTPQERTEVVESAARIVEENRAALLSAGITCNIVTGGGTGSFIHDKDHASWDELQCGSYAFMDADYAKNQFTDTENGTGFEHSLFIHTMVMSTNQPNMVICDAGLKAVASDSGNPIIHGHEHLSYRMTSDEHGNIDLDGKTTFNLCDRVHLIPGHCDPNVNLYDWYVGIRNGTVEKVWPIAARGALL